MKLYGWQLNVEEATPGTVFEAKIHLCDICYGAKFPFGLIYDGEAVYCPHLFARKVKEKMMVSSDMLDKNESDKDE